MLGNDNIPINNNKNNIYIITMGASQFAYLCAILMFTENSKNKKYTCHKIYNSHTTWMST